MKLCWYSIVTGKLSEVVERLVNAASKTKSKLARSIGSDDDFAVLGSDEDMVFEEVDRYKKNEDLMVDLTNYKVMFGEETIRYAPIVALEQLEIEMILPPLDIITFTTAKAWGVDPSTPIIIKVRALASLISSLRCPFTTNII